MKKMTMLGAVVSTALMVSAGNALAATELKTTKDRMSYIMGYNVGQQLAQAAEELDVSIIDEAIADARAGKPPAITQEEAQAAIAEFQAAQQAKSAVAAQVVGDANLKEGQDFLAANKTKEGVKTTASGLQYKVEVAGTGPKPTSASKVSVHYKGTLLDGSTFDSSYDRGQPAEFGVTQVIPGWTEALMMMPEGSKWTLYLPSDLAYGPAGAGESIGPNAALVFEVELLKASVQ